MSSEQGAAAPRHKSGMQGGKERDRRWEGGAGERKEAARGSGVVTQDCDIRPDPAVAACVLFPDQKARSHLNYCL